MKTVSIIGFGRFGKTLYRLLCSDFSITIYKPSEFSQEELALVDKQTKIAKNLEEAYASETIFFAVPIVKFETVIKAHKKYFKPEHVLLDVLSVKVYPATIFKKYLKGTTQAILTHPMFGPDSSKNGFENLPFIMDKFLAKEEVYNFWKNYFIAKKLRVINMDAETHDRFSANSLGVAQFIGRLLDNFNFTPTPIDSLGAIKLQEIKQQACNDTWELFVGLQTYNPYTKHMRLQFGHAYDTLYNQLLPKQINTRYLTFGIQGGKGSFNEQALQSYVERNNIKKYKTSYLYTTEKVLKNLHEGNIDFALFAISNSTGGLVEESIQAMGNYQFTIVEDFTILIQHFLMKRKDVEEKDITTIMAHQQVLLQCKNTLQTKFPQLTQTTGTGDFVDTAKAAWGLAMNKILKTTAILGPKILAETYDFDIIAENLQDKADNITRFLLVKRI